MTQQERALDEDRPVAKCQLHLVSPLTTSRDRPREDEIRTSLGLGAAQTCSNLKLDRVLLSFRSADRYVASTGGSSGSAGSMSAQREAQLGARRDAAPARRSSKVSFKTAWIEETLEPPAPPTATVDSSRVLHEVSHARLEPQTCRQTPVKACCSHACASPWTAVGAEAVALARPLAVAVARSDAGPGALVLYRARPREQLHAYRELRGVPRGPGRAHPQRRRDPHGNLDAAFLRQPRRAARRAAGHWASHRAGAPLTLALTLAPAPTLALAPAPALTCVYRCASRPAARCW